MKRLAVESRLVRSIGYDGEASVLEIEYASGDLYEYRMVPASVLRVSWPHRRLALT